MSTVLFKMSIRLGIDAQKTGQRDGAYIGYALRSRLNKAAFFGQPYDLYSR